MAEPSFAELRLEEVSCHFGATVALEALSITIRRGEFIALLGPSGCGKSTALNCIAGLQPLTKGGIWLDERRIDILRPEQRGFGMVFQNYALFPHMTVRRNVGFGLLMRGLPAEEIRRRVDAVLDLVQLRAHAGKLPGQLSGGQQQRVAIARAIVIEPPVVLMDEPLSNLDARLRIEMRGEIKRIHRDLGRSTIYVTHDQEEALSMADRIVVIQDGRTRQIGTPMQIYSRPGDLDVAGFMGFRNRIDVDIERAEGDSVWARAGGLTIEGIALTQARAGKAKLVIRPEDLLLGTEGPNEIRGKAEIVEYHGRSYLVAFVLAEGAIVYGYSSAKVSPGEEVRAHVAPSRALVYADR